LYCFKLKSHPDRLLHEHIAGVWRNAERQWAECSYNFPSCSANDLRKTLQVSALFHDFGKATPWFQKYITNLEGKFTANERCLRQHGLISAFMTFGILIEMIPNNLFLPAVGFLIVRRHHGDLESYQNLLTITEEEYMTCDQQSDCIFYEEYREIVKEYGLADYVNINFLKTVIDAVKTGKFRRFRAAKNLSKGFTIEHYFVTNLLYSLLTNADKTDAIFQTEIILDSPTLTSKDVHNYKTTLADTQARTINQIRNTIYHNVNSAI